MNIYNMPAFKEEFTELLKQANIVSMPYDTPRMEAVMKIFQDLAWKYVPEDSTESEKFIGDAMREFMVEELFKYCLPLDEFKRIEHAIKGTKDLPEKID